MGGSPVSVFGWSWQSRQYCAVQLGALDVGSVRYWLFLLYTAMLFIGQGAREKVSSMIFIMVADSLVISPSEASEAALGCQKSSLRTLAARLSRPRRCCLCHRWTGMILRTLGHHQLLVGVSSRWWSSAPQVSPGWQGWFGGFALEGYSFALWLPPHFVHSG